MSWQIMVLTILCNLDEECKSMRLYKRSILATAFSDVICERLNKLFTFLLVQQCLLYHVNFVGMHDPQSYIV